MSVVGLSGWVGASTFRSARARQNSFEFSNKIVSKYLSLSMYIISFQDDLFDSTRFRCHAMSSRFIDNAAAMC